jgi:hypothetical protein
MDLAQSQQNSAEGLFICPQFGQAILSSKSGAGVSADPALTSPSVASSRVGTSARSLTALGRAFKRGEAQSAAATGLSALTGSERKSVGPSDRDPWVE